MYIQLLCQNQNAIKKGKNINREKRVLILNERKTHRNKARKHTIRT